MIVRDELQRAKRDFRAAGYLDVDAELLLAHLLGLARMDLHSSVRVEEALLGFENLIDLQEDFHSACLRRLSGEPVQYITGTAYFCNLTLEVGPGVLIPRPETELLVEKILTHLRSFPQPASVIDLGAGSGAIALAIATAIPSAHVIAVENDPGALIWLRKNCESLDAEVRIVAESVLTALHGVKADLVVANPPYIPDDQELPGDVANYEPHSALFGGADGMQIPRIFIAAAARLLKSDGLFVIEHGETQGEEIARVMGEDFVEIKLHHDLNDRPRWTSAQRNR